MTFDSNSRGRVFIPTGSFVYLRIMISAQKHPGPYRVMPLEDVPAAADALGHDLGMGMAEIYGLSNGHLLASLIVQGLHINLKHPDVVLLGVFAEGELAGAAMGIARTPVGELSWLHIFSKFEGTQAEQILLEEMVRRLRDDATTLGVIVEYLPFHRSELDGEFQLLGFQKMERLIMTADLPLALAGRKQTVPLEMRHFDSAAQCLMEAYREHPSRSLHPETHGYRNAVDYLHRVWSGNYGAVRPETLRVCCDAAGAVTALCIGSQMLPGLGFIVQIVTHPRAQGQGLGTALLTEVCQNFHASGLERVALGVTGDNPARALYERLGFQAGRPFRSYYWWRNKE